MRRTSSTPFERSRVSRAPQSSPAQVPAAWQKAESAEVAHRLVPRRLAAASPRRSGASQTEVPVVLGDEAPPIRRHFLLREDRLHRAGIDAEAAVDALFGMDEEHLEILAFAVDAVDRTDVDAGGVHGADARFGDGVGHGAGPGLRRSRGG